MSSNDQIPALTSRSLLPVFYAALKDPDQSVRHAAATLMASFDVRTIFQLCSISPFIETIHSLQAAGELLLVEALLKDESSLVRVAAAHGLLACGPRALRTLLLGLRDDDADVKQVRFW
jgi:HEAT repeat protein